MKGKMGVVLLLAVLLTGCWDGIQLDEIGIVMSIGLDREPDTGKIILTAQVIRPGALGKEKMTDEAPVILVTGKGDTIFEAIRSMVKIMDRKAFFAHTKVIVIGEGIARQGIMPVLDFFARGKEMPRYVWLCVANNAQAREILGVKNGIERIQAVYLKEMIQNQRYNLGISNSNIIDYYKKALGDGINPVMTALKIVEKSNLQVEEKQSSTKGVKLSGTAVFKNDRLAGYLDEMETKGMNWILDEVKGGVVTFPSFMEEGKLMSIEVLRANTKIIPKINDSRVTFAIEVSGEISVVETQSYRMLNRPSEILKLVDQTEKATKKVIMKEIKAAVEKAQKDVKSDIFGFGSELNKKYPEKWKEIKGEWSDMFPNIDYTVTVNINAKRTGLQKSPFEPKE
ncbi:MULTISPECIES: Ger(x)C family spore germination protein [Paenibacillus]|uniref:Ger(x)C family spore germination protein n=1 Tax=Paenibacillus TaxID=44249 RepID=UPI002FE2C0F0